MWTSVKCAVTVKVHNNVEFNCSFVVSVNLAFGSVTSLCTGVMVSATLVDAKFDFCILTDVSLKFMSNER